LYLALGLWRLLHTRCSHRLLPLLTLVCRASLLGRGLDLAWSLNVFATPVLWLRVGTDRNALLRSRTLDFLLLWTSRLGCFLPSPLSRYGRLLSCLLFKMLADYRFTRLVTVMLAA
jgi:hypothetical protein